MKHRPGTLLACLCLLVCHLPVSAEAGGESEASLKALPLLPSPPENAEAKQGRLQSADAEKGMLLIRAFKPKEYKGSPVVTRLGINPIDSALLATSNTQLLRFDGETWEAIETETPGLRSLATDKEGRVWLAGVDQLGFCAQEANGHWAFHPLADKLPEEHKKLGRIWDTVVTEDSVWFATETRVLRWHKEAFTVWSFPGTGTLLSAGERLFLQRKNEVLLEWNGATFTELSRSPLVAGPSLMRLFQAADQRIIGMNSEGYFFALQGKTITPLLQELKAQLGKSRVICAYPRLGGAWILGTESGALLVDAKGAIERRLNQESGLTDSPIMDITADADGALWLASLSGIFQIEEPEGASFFSEEQGLSEGISQALVRHEGTLYVSSSSGLLRLKREADGSSAHFELVPGSPPYPQKIISSPLGLLVPYSGGLLCFDGANFRPLLDKPLSIISLCQGKKQPKLLLAGLSDGVALYTLGETLTPLGDPLLGLGQVRSIDEDKNGDFWLCTSTRGIIKLHLPEGGEPSTKAELTSYNTENSGLPAGRNSSFGLRSPSGLFFNALSASLRLDSTSGQLVVEDRILCDGAPLPIINAMNHGNGRTWVSVTPEGENARSILGCLGAQGVGELKPLSSALQKRSGTFGANLIHIDDKAQGGIVWFRGIEGLLRLDPEKLRTPCPPAKVRLTRVESEGVVRPLDKTLGPPFKYTLKPLLIEYTATALASGAGLRYQSRLLGWDDEWSDWTDNKQLRFSGLHGGKYRLELRAKDSLGRVGPITSQSFSVTPPWWLSPYSLVAYFLVGSAAIAGFINWRLRRATQERQRLEALVARRTEELAEARDKAEQANRAKSAFLASMSHELRTPLNGVIGYSQLLDRDQGLNTEQRRGLQIIRRSGEHLLRMINDVLDLAKIEAGKLELNAEPLNLEELVRDLCPAHENAARQKGLNFSAQLGATLPEWILQDGQKLRQILDNIIGNAVKFTETGAVLLSMETTGVGTLCIRISDTGPGIRPEERERLFKPFEQAGKSRSHTPGTGLGLSICRALCEKMGGTLTLLNKPRPGSCFELLIPYQACTPPATRKEAEALPLSYSGPKCRVAVVDDNEINRTLIEALLCPLGFLVKTYSSGEALLNALPADSNSPLELAIIDVRMEGIDGLETSRRLRAAYPEMRILLSSASVLSFNHEEGRRAGCDAFLPKPFHSQELFRALEQLLPIRWNYAPASEDYSKAESATSTPQTTAASQSTLGTADYGVLSDSLALGDIEALREALVLLRENHPDDTRLKQVEDAAQAIDLARLRLLLSKPSTPSQ